MTSRPERILSGSLEIDEIQAKFSISKLPSPDTHVLVWNGRSEVTKPLVLEQVFQLEPNGIVEKPLKIILSREKKAISRKKHGGEGRPGSEIESIRKSFEKMRETLHSSGPGEILAAIALNPGKEVRWTLSGLVGEDRENWLEPSEFEEERLWWSWAYSKEQKGVEIKKLLKGREGDILHAFFVMRYRRMRDSISPSDFDYFVSSITHLVAAGDEELIAFLEDIADKFPTPFSNGQKRILQLKKVLRRRDFSGKRYS